MVESSQNAINLIKKQSVSISKFLENDKLMESLKCYSLVLNQLRLGHLKPKQYYELYLAVFDSLSILKSYLYSNFISIDSNANKINQLQDLYELVQYSGNVLPRLYLMITVGSVILASNDESTPSRELLKDMIEMSRGIQNPTRGLFLRYYLSQMTNDYFNNNHPSTKEDLLFDLEFNFNNFTEMNKLWVRLQHQGPLRERDLRSQERIDLKILIGSQLVKLSQLIDANNWDIYNDVFLKNFLLQLIQCNDKISQEYLFDVLFQIFPLNFHLKSLNSYLKTLPDLNSSVSIDLIFKNLISKFIISKDEIEKNSLDFTMELFNFVDQFLSENKDYPIENLCSLLNSLIALNLIYKPSDFHIIDKIFNILNLRLELNPKKEKDTHLIEFLLCIGLNEYIDDKPNFYYNLIKCCGNFINVINILDNDSSLKIILPILNELCQSNKLDNIIPLNDSNDFNFLRNFLKFLNPVLSLNDFDISNPIIELLLKFINQLLFVNINIKHLRNLKQLNLKIEFILILKNWFSGNPNLIRIFYPLLITNFWKLIRYIDHLKCKIKNNENITEYCENQLKQLFKYISRCINDIFNYNDKTDIELIDLIFKLFLQTASISDQLMLNEVSYDFYSQSITLYEEYIVDSTPQFQALIYLIQSLQKTRSLYSEENYYNILILKCISHSTKLLKKNDQCRAVYYCSHLWWQTEISSIGENEELTKFDNRNGKRVLECLQRSLRVADSIMDNVLSCELMIEILNRCLYFFIPSNSNYDSTISINYINGLIELIKVNLNSLKLQESTIENNQFDSRISASSPSSRGLDIVEDCVISVDGNFIEYNKNFNKNSASLSKTNQLLQVPLSHFNRTCEYIIEQRDIDERFTMIII
ncbi:hypothetical protein Kpol_2002p79 [Vanderwaltozyma polyspora DSM 70294]|uniref:Vacuolar protein sorting-associated protein 35 n=1 Tax=Vanderwaltozyma polyspora (strain ATCC 22028 / DSM 70294 / BCRC 21397 / CBS 2163 / NBRC 10782 / NRRL Y-8283 / UCD 57-17) TaxID=436907 RepID=A7TFJ4_VANPO|nr:uncharacterized protein Kpol_2002p79 [Vanderwaltozyma polyspora DSM 70294]EDO19008.1 hypothetical protein Kpol_2002p79 [Vanderwaltozyma polyspora DSM 70294]